ncbi:hypothetical protein [Hymenobacter sp. GOD-10R]|uniref:hypothetical protein n=1 Tax=Hymenobacter sp. GOD-10R TaxID=3093922 RepID=UPI002D79E51C|nr:hypothetical protein [Hymenobacter sp. GOD-10R]WRQ27968.1 hypothetical protein SD425_23120 [Hymenobacter sp. GOD-10R]
MKINLLLALLLLAASLSAQNITPTGNSNATDLFPAVQIQKADTTQAIRRLFQNRRRGGRFFAVYSGLGVGGISYAAAQPVTESATTWLPYTAANKRQVVIILTVETLPLLVVGIEKLSRFSRKKKRSFAGTKQVSH